MLINYLILIVIDGVFLYISDEDFGISGVGFENFVK